MKRLSKILALVLVLMTILSAVSAFTVSAASQTATIDYTKLYSSDTSLNGVKTTEGEVVISMANNGASSVPKYYKNGTAVRIYGKNSVTISVADG